MNALFTLLQSALVITLFTPIAQAECGDCTLLDFGKKAQVAQLSPLLGGTMKSKTDYLQNIGLDLFRIPAPQEVPTIGFLPTPPADLLKVFGKHFEEDALAIYLTERSYSNHVHKPTILLIESADSWTIAHEFMHHLFDRARFMEDPTMESKVVNNMSDAKEDFLESWSKYKMNNRYLDANHRDQTIESFVHFIEVQLRLLLTFEMEEMAIEKFLRTMYIQNQTDFDRNSFDRSTRYIGKNGTKALTILEVTLETCKDLRRTLTSTEASQMQTLARACQKATDLKESVLKLGQDLQINFSAP